MPHPEEGMAGSNIYLGAALFMILLNIAGFAPSLIDQSKRNAPPGTTVIAHGLLASTWLGLFLAQALFVRMGHLSGHRRLGWMGPAVAALLVATGVMAVLEFGKRGFDLSGDLARFPPPGGPQTREDLVANMSAPLLAFAAFGALVGAGVWFRRRPEIHKRLMLFSLLSLGFTPLLHLGGRVLSHWPELYGTLVIAAPLTFVLILFSIAVHDRWSTGRIHPVSLWMPIVILLVVFGVAPVIALMPWWRTIALWLMSQ
jgi:multisubunit Na+/H+ antiporter MnhC subunit